MREITPQELAERKGHFLDEFARAAAHSNGTTTAQALYELLQSQRGALVEFDGGCAVFDSIGTDDGSLIRIVAVSGGDMQRWISQIDEAAMTLARKTGARGVIASGRPGWKREAKKHGYAVTHITVFKEVVYA